MFNFDKFNFDKAFAFFVALLLVAIAAGVSFAVRRSAAREHARLRDANAAVVPMSGNPPERYFRPHTETYEGHLYVNTGEFVHSPACKCMSQKEKSTDE